MTLYTEPGLPGQLPHIFGDLRSLDLFILDTTDISVLFQYIRAIGQTLERFPLTADSGHEFGDWIENWVAGEQKDVACGMPNLTELRLAHIDVSELFGALSKIINFHSLIRLAILSHTGGQHLLTELDENSECQGLRLTHIVTELPDFWESEYEDFRETLHSLLRKCAPLESFHIYYHTPGWHPQDVLRHSPSGQLRSLSLHCGQWTDRSESLERGSLYHLFRGTLGNLQEFGYHIPEGALLVPRNGDYL
jgi:hypothetical protein